MGDMFSELEKMGFRDISDKELFEAEKPHVEEKEDDTEKIKKAELAEAIDLEKSSLFDKKFECPVCDTKFTDKAVRTGKTRLQSTDTDLRHRYKGFDPIKYDIIACPNCGYAAMGLKSFMGLSSLQRKLLREQVQAQFKGLPPTGELLSYEDALARYKLALYSSMVKKSRLSERAYLCLKIAWLYRGMKENLEEGSKDYETNLEKYKAEEMDYLNKAYNGFGTAVQNEMFPICGMDEMTYDYLYGELARRTGHMDMAKKMIGTVLVSKSASAALKDKARDIKELIRSEEEKSE